MTVRASAPLRLARPSWRRAVASPVPFVIPYVPMFLLLVVYPVGYGFFLGHSPGNYRQLFNNPTYLQSVINTVLFVGVGVNVKMFLALLLSGFFAIPRWWAKVLLAVFSTSGYVIGPGFRAMREYLRRTCSAGWIIDLTPEGQTPPVPTRVFPGVR